MWYQQVESIELGVFDVLTGKLHPTRVYGDFALIPLGGANAEQRLGGLPPFVCVDRKDIKLIESVSTNWHVNERGAISARPKSSSLMKKGKVTLQSLLFPQNRGSPMFRRRDRRDFRRRVSPAKH